MLDGHCLCGAVTVRAEPKDGYFTACNCENCRRWTSGISFSFVADEATAVIDGPVKTIAPLPWAERGFCAECGSPVFYRITGEGGLQGLLKLSVGLFDDAAGLPLGLEFFADKKPAAFDFTRGHRTMTEAEVDAAFFKAE